MIRADQISYALGNPSINPEVRKGYVIPKDYFKIREIALSYTLPEKYLIRTPLTAASFSLIGRNLFLFTPKKNNYVDPEVSNFGDDILTEFGETSGGSSTRNYGLGIKLSF